MTHDDHTCPQIILEDGPYVATDDGYVYTRLWFDCRAGVVGPFEQADMAEEIPGNA